MSDKMISKRSNRGFTMMEMLIAVAILVILMALGFIAVMNYQRSMKQLELDRTAQEIYVAAQNHLTQAEAEGVLKQRLTNDAKGDEAERGEMTYHYFFVTPDDGRLTSKSDTVLYDMLPAFSLEDTVRTGGSYVIEYDLDSATVTNVFYSDQSDLSKYQFDQANFSSQYGTFFGDPGLIGSEHAKDRLDGTNTDKQIIGWYGGDDAKGLKKTELYAPKVELINAERLEVKVSIPANAISRMTQNFNPLLQIFIQGETSGEENMQVVNKESGANGSELGETLQNFKTTSTLDVKGGVGYRTKTYVLDDVTKRENHFYTQWCTDAKRKLIPGENVKVQAIVRSTTIADGAIANQAKSGWSASENSLYKELAIDSTVPAKPTASAKIANFRHLENLDPKISEYAQSAELKEAVQENDMTWQDFLSKTGGASTQVYPIDNKVSASKAGTYMPVVPQKTDQPSTVLINLEKYEGNNHATTGVVVDNAANAGLFGNVNGGTIQNLKLCDFNIKTSNGSAGALAGSILGTTVTNVLAYNSQSDDGSKEIVASGAAGGLVGSVAGTTGTANPLALTNNAAAVYVRSTGGSAGGLLGSTSDNVSITGCYAGGHTKDGMYLSDRTEKAVGRVNVQAQTESGGLVGNAGGTLTVNNSYATTSVYGATAGGFLGKAAAGSISNSYATGLVVGASDNATVGTFAGDAGSITYGTGENTTVSYLDIINYQQEDEDKMPVVGSGNGNGITMADASLEAYATFASGTKQSAAYDSTLTRDYNGLYPFKTIGELSGQSDAAGAMAMHYGDWQRPDTMVVNSPGSVGEVNSSSTGSAHSILVRSGVVKTASAKTAGANTESAKTASTATESTGSTGSQTAAATATTDTPSLPTAAPVVAETQNVGIVKQSTEAPARKAPELSKTLKSVDGRTYNVKVTFNVDEQLPTGAELKVVELNQLPDDWNDATNQETKYKDRPFATERLVTKEDLAKRAEQMGTGLDLNANEDSLFYQKYLNITVTAGGAAFEPQRAVNVTVETDAIDIADSPAVEVGYFDTTTPENTVKSLTVENKTENLPREEQKSKTPTKFSFQTTRLGEFGVVGAAHAKVAVREQNELFVVQAAKTQNVWTDTVDFPELKTGLAPLAAFAPNMDAVPAYGGHVWIEAKRLPDTNAAHDENAGMEAYRLDDGVVSTKLFGVAGTTRPMKVEVGMPMLLVWATGVAPSETTATPAQDEMTALRPEDAANPQVNEPGVTPQQTTPQDSQAVPAQGSQAQTKQTVPEHKKYTYVAASGSAYMVTAQCASTAGIPENAQLTVAETPKGTEYLRYMAAGAKELGITPHDVSAATALDISFVDPITGRTYQPDEKVRMTIAPLNTSLHTYERVGVVHFGTQPEAMSVQREGSAVAFDTDHFSIFTVMTYTSELSWGAYTYNFGSETEALLSDVLTSFGVTDVLASDVTMISTSDEKVTASQVDGVWKLVAQNGTFDDPVTMNLTLEGGQTQTLQMSAIRDTSKTAVTVKADAKDKTYGDVDPTLTATVDPEAAASGISYSVNRDKGDQENAGTYVITPSGDTIQGSYVVSYVPAAFTINRAAVTVTADDKTKTYGEADPELTATVSGLKRGDQPSVISYTCARATGEDVSSEGYAITPSGNAVQGNYDVTYVSGKLTIARAAATVTADDKTKTYGAADPELTATVSGLKRGDQPSVISYTCDRATGEDVSSEGYAITPSGNAVQGNYDVTYEPGTLTITPRLLTVRPADASKAYGDPDPELQAPIISGLLDDEEVHYDTASQPTGVVTIARISKTGQTTEQAVSYVVSRESGEDAGQYLMSATGDAEQGNFALEYETNFFVIYPKVTVKKVLVNEALADTVTVPFTVTKGSATSTFELQVSKTQTQAEHSLAISSGDSLTIAETPNTDYTTTVSINDGDPSDATSCDLQNVTDNLTTVTFTNTRKPICQIGDRQFVTISDAVSYAGTMTNKTATIEMLNENYDVLSVDKVEIPAGYNITLTRQGTGEPYVIKRTEAFGDNNLLTNKGALTLTNIVIDGNNTQTSTALINNTGTLTVSANATIRNAATVNGSGVGGAISASAGEVHIAGLLTGNHATNGSALHVTGSAKVFVENNAQITGNTASKGALYVERGEVSIAAGSITANNADNGGALYATGGTIGVTGGTIAGNVASNQHGGAMYIENGTLNISGGTLGGTSGGNTALNGNGGAVYVDRGTLNFTGGTISGNVAKNGSAIFVNSTGSANFSTGGITGNEATEGGAVGVGSTTARLNFSDNASITGNTLQGTSEQRNVYLDQESSQVINSLKINNKGNKIGIYVPGEQSSTLVRDYGDICGNFGSYTNANNVANVFRNDRYTDLSVYAEKMKMYWGKALKYEVYELASYTNNKFPPTNGSKKHGEASFMPRKTTNSVYDMVVGNMQSIYSTKLTKGVVYAYAYASTAMTSFDQYLTDVNWNGTTRTWEFVKRDGMPAQNVTRMRIVYSNPTFLSIVNNTDQHLQLDVTKLEVLNKDMGTQANPYGYYGYVTAKNGATVETLLPITSSDMSLAHGGSIKLLFPGACGVTYSLGGQFTGGAVSAGIPYLVDGVEKGSIATSTFVLPSTDTILPDVAGTTEIVFGKPLPICKVTNGGVEHPFTSLKSAMQYIQDNSLTTATIEMVTDYLLPNIDELNVPAGYNVTLTTAGKGSELTYPYVGTGTRATISRDSGRVGSFVKAEGGPNEDGSGYSLTVKDLVLDGRSLSGSGNGGAISTKNCTVDIDHVDFKGFQATNGGAIYIDHGYLHVHGTCNFTNCVTNSTTDKTGGGAIWVSARKIMIEDASFDSCACLQGVAQAGAIFHNILKEYSDGSDAQIKRCTFDNCYAVGGSGGAVESDALDVHVIGCDFTGCYSNKVGGSGGALNTYTNNEANTTKTSSLEVANCTFDRCTSLRYGGAIRSTPRNTTITNVTITNCSSDTGGAISVNNTNSDNLTLNNVTITDCTATGTGGANGTGGGISCDYTKVVAATGVTITNCTAKNGGGIYHNNNNANGSVTLTSCRFEDCIAHSGNGGGVRTFTKVLSVNGGATTAKDTTEKTFVNCTASDSGGGLWHGQSMGGSKTTLDGCVVDGCTASGNNGGGIYTTALTVDAKGGSSIANSSARACGGGIYISPTTATFDNCSFTNNSVSNSDSKGGGIYQNAGTVTYTNSTTSGCSAAYGGGVYVRDNNAYKFTMKSGSINGTATNGGGVWTAGTFIQEDGSVTGSAVDGGGVYVAKGSFTANGGTVGGSATNGGGLYSAAGTTNLNEGSVVRDATATSGGGVYVAGGTLNLGGEKNTGGDITNNSANNGGGIYVVGGSCFIRKSSITKNHADSNGGGVYHAGGKLGMYAGTIGGSDENANTAQRGAGVFVANGQTATFDGWIDTANITHNHATVEGGGIAVGGSGAVLEFKNTVIVKDNTAGQLPQNNVYLDQNSNSVIKCMESLNAASYIGVYVSNQQMAAHGNPGMPFGSFVKSTNFDRFISDRDSHYYGVSGAQANTIYWAQFVCKITDADGNLLYRDEEATRPAVYARLDVSNESERSSSAFGTLRLGLQLYKSDKTPYSGAYQVQMLVQEYAATAQVQAQVNSPGNKTVTLTTASDQPDPEGFYFPKDVRHPQAVVIRGGSYQTSMINVNASNTVFNTTGITLDGGSEFGRKATSNGGILATSGQNCLVTVGTGTILRNSSTTVNGGAIHHNWSPMIIDGATITNCHADGKGGGIFSETSQPFTIRNFSTISGCSAAQGGGLYVVKSKEVSYSDSTITGNTATTKGGGIAVEGGNARLYFSGIAKVTGNTCVAAVAPRNACNVELSIDNDNIINSRGLSTQALIGVYVPNGTNLYDKHGKENKPFGKYADNSNLAQFVNDRNNLRGGVLKDNVTIHWLPVLTLEVSKKVNSNRAADASKTFEFTVTMRDKDGEPVTGTHGDMTFTDGTATFRLRNGQRASAVFLPENVNGTSVQRMEDATYEVVETEDPGFTTESTGASGTLGEKNEDEEIILTNYATFENTRKTGSLEVSKTVDSSLESDEDTEFSFTVRLDDRTINTTGDVSYGDMTFVDGVASLRLKSGEKANAIGLPTEVGYTVTENLTSAQRSYYRTTPGLNIRGTIGENLSATENPSDLSKASFTNTHKDYVCKITTDYGLMRYRDGEGNLRDAVFGTLKDAFDVVNSGAMFTSSGGTYSGKSAIEMLVGEYAMTQPVNSNKVVTLTTASKNATDGYPYTGNDTAVIKRGYNEAENASNGGALFTVAASSLTFDTITIDGQKDSFTGRAAYVGGGSLVAQNKSTIRRFNSVGNSGAAVMVAPEASMTIKDDAVIAENESTADGPGVYLSEGSALRISGAPNFGGAGIADDGTVNPASGNVKNETLSGAANGGAAYAKPRQDIFIAGYGDDDAASLIVAGAIASGDGSIWVWPAEQRHIKNQDQFAVIADNVTADATTLGAFRDARTDDDAQNSGSYLRGTTGANASHVYWGPGGKRKVILRKVGALANGRYESLAGAKFRIYSSAWTQLADVEYTSGPNGVYFVGELPYGIYHLVETVFPQGYELEGYEGYDANTPTTWLYYKLTVGDPDAEDAVVDKRGTKVEGLFRRSGGQVTPHIPTYSYEIHLSKEGDYTVGEQGVTVQLERFADGASTGTYTDGVTWQTSDANVIQVAADGTLTFVGPGQATISALVNGNVVATTPVLTVKAASNVAVPEPTISTDHGKGMLAYMDLSEMAVSYSGRDFYWEEKTDINGVPYLALRINTTDKYVAVYYNDTYYVAEKANGTDTFTNLANTYEYPNGRVNFAVGQLETSEVYHYGDWEEVRWKKVDGPTNIPSSTDGPGYRHVEANPSSQNYRPDAYLSGQIASNMGSFEWEPYRDGCMVCVAHGWSDQVAAVWHNGVYYKVKSPSGADESVRLTRTEFKASDLTAGYGVYDGKSVVWQAIPDPYDWGTIDESDNPPAVGSSPTALDKDLYPQLEWTPGAYEWIRYRNGCMIMTAKNDQEANKNVPVVWYKGHYYKPANVSQDSLRVYHLVEGFYPEHLTDNEAHHYGFGTSSLDVTWQLVR